MMIASTTQAFKTRKGNQGDYEFRKKIVSQSGVDLSDCSNLFGEIFTKGSDDYFEPTKTPSPTHYPPGSQEKMVIMSLRLMAGEHLHHDDDAEMAATIEKQVEMADFVKHQYGGRKWKNGKLASVGP